MYDYHEAVFQAVEEEATNSYTPEMLEPVDLEDYEEKLNDALWVNDGVTGNASGFFFRNPYKAEEALVGNWDLAAEALYEFGYNEGFNLFEKRLKKETKGRGFPLFCLP